jgi:hypothetical protein
MALSLMLDSAGFRPDYVEMLIDVAELLSFTESPGWPSVIEMAQYARPSLAAAACSTMCCRRSLRI